MVSLLQTTVIFLSGWLFGVLFIDVHWDLCVLGGTERWLQVQRFYYVHSKVSVQTQSY